MTLSINLLRAQPCSGNEGYDVALRQNLRITFSLKSTPQKKHYFRVTPSHQCPNFQGTPANKTRPTVL